MDSTLPAKKKILVVQTKAPFGSSAIQESLDIVLAAGTFDQDISLLIEGDACYQLLDRQQADLINKKNTTKMLKALPLYGIDTIFVCAESTSARKIPLIQSDTVKFINHKDIAKLYKTSDTVIRF